MSDHTNKPTVDVVAAMDEEAEACAVLVDRFTRVAHIAHDMAQGLYPSQSDLRYAISAAIRARISARAGGHPVEGGEIGRLRATLRAIADGEVEPRGNHIALMQLARVALDD